MRGNPIGALAVLIAWLLVVVALSAALYAYALSHWY